MIRRRFLRVPSASAPRLTVVDLLRFVAAMAVLFFHFTARDHQRWGQELPYQVFPWLSEVSRYGYLGVHLFFVISGFVILTSAWRRSGGAFVASRVSRLYPAYWLAVLLTATLRWLWPSFDGRTPTEVLVNLTMFQDLFEVPRVDGVYWTLWVELQFYLLILLFIRVGLTLRRVLVVAAVVPLVTVPLSLMDLGWFGRFTLIEWAPLFCAGMVISVLYRTGHRPIAWAVLALDTAAAVVMSQVKTIGAIDSIASGHTTSPVLIGVLVVACVAAVAAAALLPALTRTDWRVFTLLGLLTYPLYLTHEYVGWATIEVLAPHLGRFGTLALAILVCVAVAVLVHRVAERPFQRRMRRGLEHLLRVRPVVRGRDHEPEPL